MYVNKALWPGLLLMIEFPCISNSMIHKRPSIADPSSHTAITDRIVDVFLIFPHRISIFGCLPPHRFVYIHLGRALRTVRKIRVIYKSYYGEN